MFYTGTVKALCGARFLEGCRATEILKSGDEVSVNNKTSYIE